MREGWLVTTLGELCTLTKGATATMKAVPGPYPLVVTAEERGSCDSYQFEGEAVCVPLVSSTGHGHASLKRVHYQEGRFAVANIITACQTRGDAPVNMKYLWLLLDHQRNELIVPLMKGTANVSLSQRNLATVPLTLPPLEEQRRTVDLISCVDAVISAAADEVAAAREALSQLSRLGNQAPTRPLGALATMRSGPSWDKTREYTSAAAGRVPVLGITNTPPGLTLDLSSRRYVTDLPASTVTLSERSLVMIRTNGNRNRIGNIYRATTDVTGHAVSAFQIAIEPSPQSDPDYLYWYLGSPEVQASISQNASGTTGLGNVAVGWLKRLQIPLLSDQDQRAYVARCDAAGQVVERALSREQALRGLRSSLLAALLSGQHQIPDGYDQLLAG